MRMLDKQTNEGKKYAVVSTVIPPAGWATKESCRRPGERFSPDLVALLRWCFDAKPRLNNYQIQNQFRKKYKIGPQVLRISQISGWVTSEVQRRKKAALAAAADVANMIKEAEIKGAELTAEDEAQVATNHTEAALGLGLANAEVGEAAICGWKRKWRWQLHQRFPALREQRLMAAEDEAGEQQRQECKRQKRQQEKKERQQKQQGKVERERQKEKSKAEAEQQKLKEGGEREQQEKQAGATKSKQPAPAQKRRKQPDGTEHCWTCWLDVPVAEYNYKTQSCRDSVACNNRVKGNTNKRQRTKKTQHGD